MSVVRIENLNIVNDVPVHHKQIEPSIKIKINEFCPEPELRKTRLPQPGGEGDVGEKAVPFVLVERVRFSAEVGDEEVWKTVPVIIAKVDAHSRFRLTILIKPDAGEQGVLTEDAGAVVNEKVIHHFIIGHVDIHVPVAVEVSGDNAEPLPVHSGYVTLFRHVAEGAVLVVSEEAVGDAREDVRIAVGSRNAALEAQWGFEIPEM